MNIHSTPVPGSHEVHSLDGVHLNARSIRNKLNHLSKVVESFQIHEACYRETHLDNDIDSISFLGFDEPIREDRTRNGGRIIVYMSSLLRYNKRHALAHQIGISVVFTHERF